MCQTIFQMENTDREFSPYFLPDRVPLEHSNSNGESFSSVPGEEKNSNPPGFPLCALMSQ